MNKQQYIESIVTLARANTSEDYPTAELESFLTGLQYFSIKQLSSIHMVLSAAYKPEKDPEVLFYQMQKKGMLSVAPQVVQSKNSELPSLLLRGGAYLHWFRGYCFQVSQTEDGQCSHGSSITTLSSDLRCTEENSMARNVVIFAHMAEAAAHFDEFFQMVQGDASTLDEFVNRMRGVPLYTSTFSVAALKDLVHKEHGTNASDFVYLGSSGKVKVCVEEPSVYVAIHHSEWEYYRMDIPYEYENPWHNTEDYQQRMQERYLTALLALLNVSSNTMNVTPRWKGNLPIPDGAKTALSVYHM